MDSEVALPLSDGFRAPVENLAALVVAEAVAHAVVAVEEMRARAWATVITEPCGLEREDGLPFGRGLPGRAAQISKTLVSRVVSNALDSMKAARVNKWRAIRGECPCVSKFDYGLPPAKGLPRRTSQLASDVVAAAIKKATATSFVETDIVEIDEKRGNEECCICLGQVLRPVELQCGHVFCADCLLRLVSEDRSYANRACPLCRGQLYSLPEDEGEDTVSDVEDEFERSLHFGFQGLSFFFYCSVTSDVQPSYDAALETRRGDDAVVSW